jgi:hypothetical protein
MGYLRWILRWMMTMNCYSRSWSYYRLNYHYPRFRFQSSHLLSYRLRLQNFHLLNYRLHRYPSRLPRASVAEVVAGTLQTRR